MNLKRATAVSLSTVVLLLGGSGAAQADGGSKFNNDSKILSCFSLELLDIPILSSANNNIDCSTNIEKHESREETKHGDKHGDKHEDE
ncbi:hypothetical protein GCM10010420_04890 [Streptomyces glaucosporus]|uniref:Secreted protein n=1 Tax=Streptomyces glaucosporus TaxID=284044 RepID=A0ABN3HQ52_9ACTN